jgi:hypothetical protein
MKNAVFWDVKPADLLKTDVSEETNTSIIRVTRTDELGKLAVTNNRSSIFSLLASVSSYS